MIRNVLAVVNPKDIYSQNTRCTRMEFAPFCAPFVGKNMLIFANICKNTCCKSVVKTLINQGNTRKKANDKSTIRLPRHYTI